MIKAIELDFIIDTNELDIYGNEIVSRETLKVGATLMRKEIAPTDNENDEEEEYTLRVAMNTHDIISNRMIFQGYEYKVDNRQEQEILSYVDFTSVGKYD